MIADFFTKPLQGGLFKYMRDMIMGITDLPIEERVEKDGTDEMAIRRAAVNKRLNGTTKQTYVDVVKGIKNEKRPNEEMKISELV
jgi:hypothetical protein